jgi:hypothetical protein
VIEPRVDQVRDCHNAQHRKDSAWSELTRERSLEKESDTFLTTHGRCWPD